MEKKLTQSKPKIPFNMNFLKNVKVTGAAVVKRKDGSISKSKPKRKTKDDS